MPRRASLMCWLLCFAAAAAAQRPEPNFPPVRPGVALTFPRDHGSHPDYRTEWWYLTGQVKTASGTPLGVQVTFFRSRTGIGEDNKSRFAPGQLYFAHAAIADVRHGKLRHDQKVARGVAGLVSAAESDASSEGPGDLRSTPQAVAKRKPAPPKGDGFNIRIDNWTLRREAESDAWIANLPANGFAMQLRFAPTQPMLLQGDAGFSRKGPEDRFSSYYYSLPHLAISGTITLGDKTETVSGTAWMDHEWSSEILMPGAVGWDWAGINLDDGGALMVFRIRDKSGNALWAAATWRDAKGVTRKFAAHEIAFTPNQTWRSPASGASYPVDANIRVGDATFRLQPLMPDQELDSRASTGAIYWEGAVTVLRDGQRVGAGYLEMTGYTERIRF